MKEQTRTTVTQSYCVPTLQSSNIFSRYIFGPSNSQNQWQKNRHLTPDKSVASVPPPGTTCLAREDAEAPRKNKRKAPKPDVYQRNKHHKTLLSFQSFLARRQKKKGPNTNLHENTPEKRQLVQLAGLKCSSRRLRYIPPGYPLLL